MCAMVSFIMVFGLVHGRHVSMCLPKTLGSLTNGTGSKIGIGEEG